MDKANGVVYHEIAGNVSEDLAKNLIGKPVKLEVDETTRRLHARLHSGGHLLDNAVAELGLPWSGAKGHHFATSSYVEYSMSKEDKKSLTDARKKQVLEDLNQAISKLTASDISTQVSKNNENVRTVSIAGVSCPCGGTHVKNVNELQGLVVKGFKSKSGNLQVKYHFE